MAESRSEHQLTPREVAWLTRVNDDTVRAWFRHPDFPPTSHGQARTTAGWNELVSWCAQQRRQAPLPIEALSLTPEELESLMQLAKAEPDSREIHATGARSLDIGSSPSRSNQDLVAALNASLERERRLRIALREKVSGAAHSRADAAASDRALIQLIDELESKAEGPT